MKNILSIPLILIALGLSIPFTSCKEGTKEQVKEAGEAVVEETREAAEKVGEAAKDAGAAVKEAAGDATEAVKDAAGDAEDALMEGIEQVRIRFASGANSKTIENSITGDETIDYKLQVREGQLMNISMATEGGSPYFNVMEPGEKYEAIFVGSTSGGQFEGVAAKSGDYTIRVYMMRSAARRGETADYRLEMIVGD